MQGGETAAFWGVAEREREDQPSRFPPALGGAASRLVGGAVVAPDRRPPTPGPCGHHPDLGRATRVIMEPAVLMPRAAAAAAAAAAR